MPTTAAESAATTPEPSQPTAVTTTTTRASPATTTLQPDPQCAVAGCGKPCKGECELDCNAKQKAHQRAVHTLQARQREYAAFLGHPGVDRNQRLAFQWNLRKQEDATKKAEEAANSCGPCPSWTETFLCQPDGSCGPNQEPRCDRRRLHSIPRLTPASTPDDGSGKTADPNEYSIDMSNMHAREDMRGSKGEDIRHYSVVSPIAKVCQCSSDPHPQI